MTLAQRLFSAADEHAAGSINADEFCNLMRVCFREDGQDFSPETLEAALMRVRAWKVARLAEEHQRRSSELVMKRRNSLLEAATLEDYSFAMQAKVHAQLDAQIQAETEAQDQRERDLQLTCKDFEEMLQDGVIQIAGIGATMPSWMEMSVCNSHRTVIRF
jgi:hypothetical protein